MSLVLEKLCILLSELHRCTLLGCFISIHAVTTAAEEADEGSTGITIVVLPEVAMGVAFVVLFAVGVCIARKRHKVSDVCEWWWWGGGEIYLIVGDCWVPRQRSGNDPILQRLQP